MAFGADKNLNLEGQSKMVLSPGVYDGFIVDFGKESVDVYGQEGVKRTQMFITYKDSVTGRLHKDDLFRPSVADSQEKRDTANGYAVERFVHVLSRVGGGTPQTAKEKADRFVKGASFDTFDQFIDAAVQYLGSKSEVAKIEINFKIVGGVYNGNGTSKIPNYNVKYTVPFLERKDEGKRVAFSTKEKEENNKYFATVNGNGSGSGAAPSGMAGAPAGSDDLPF